MEQFCEYSSIDRLVWRVNKYLGSAPVGFFNCMGHLMANAFSEFSFEEFPLEPLPALPEFKSLINLWDVTRGDAALPVWRDFLFDDLLPWIGRLAVTEFDGEEIHALLFGGDFVKLFGREMTGKPFLASLTPAEHDLFHGHYKKVIEGPCIGYACGEFSLYENEPQQIAVIELPLATKGGDFSHILHALGAK
jgi:hypothetical protein